MSTLDMSNEPVPVEEVASTSVEEPNITTHVEEVADEEESVVSSDEEVAQPAQEVAEPAQEPEPVVAEEPEPTVADVAEEPAPEEPAPEEVKSSDNDLENRVKELEERFEKLRKMLINSGINGLLEEF